MNNLLQLRNVRLIWRHLPLPNTRRPLLLAEATELAMMQQLLARACTWVGVLLRLRKVRLIWRYLPNMRRLKVLTSNELQASVPE